MDLLKNNVKYSNNNSFWLSKNQYYLGHYI